MKKVLVALALLLGLVEPALAQWQVPTFSVPVGRGAGVTGFNSAGPCTNAQVLGWPSGVGAGPACGLLPAGALPQGTSGFALIGTGASAPTFQGFLQPGTGATTRTWQSKTADLPSLKDFGAVCDGTTNDATALSNAVAAYSSVLATGAANSTGTKCKVSTAANALTGKLFGWNTQLVDGSSNQRGYFFSAVSANQSYTATNENSVDTAFNGNFTGAQFVVEHRITGAATLTQPSTGYVYSPWAYPYYTYLYNESGFNNGTATNVGRTAAVGHRIKFYQHGQGDMVAYNCSGFGDTTRAGATNFLANPAIVCINGEMVAGAAGFYLNPLEFLLDDNGNDAAAIGTVLNLNRTVNTGALGVTWGGERIQSIGSKSIDFALSVTGPVVNGIDLTGATFTAAKVAMALPPDSRIYLNAAQSGSYGVTPNTEYVEYNSGNSCARFVVGNRVNTCIDTNGHIRVQGTAPAVTAGCGTTPSVIGSDIAGRLNTGSTASTTCTLTFAVAYNNAPFCIAQPLGVASTTAFTLTTITTTTIVFTYASATALNIQYQCYAQSGG